MGYFKAKGKKYYRKKRLIKTFIIILLIYIIYCYFHNKESTLNRINIENNYLNNTVEKEVFEEIKNPIVYIYNTHQTEKYKSSKMNEYNVDNTVIFASFLLKWYLENLGIDAIVETSNITSILKDNNLKYKDSYKASRILIENAYKETPTLNYFIDLHRDSSSYEKTTCELNDKKYAKVMFVVGLEHNNYENNLNFANILNNRIKRINSCLTRGVYKKSGSGVNGIYNQDFNSNTILIELGGQYNNIIEVNNTLKVLASILYEYIMEDT